MFKIQSQNTVQKNQIQSQKSNQQTNKRNQKILPFFFFSKSKVIFFQNQNQNQNQNQKYFSKSNSKSKVFFKIKSIFEIKTKSTITQINYNSHNQSKYVNFF